MSCKPLIRRSLADQDVLDAVDYYRQDSDEAVALKFVDALEKAFRHISCHPATGSPRYAVELDLPDLRCWPMKHYPYLIFYIEKEEHIDAWRILHGQRNTPAWLSE